MDGDPQDQSWEGDVQDDSEWYDSEVDENLTLYTMQSESGDWVESFSDSEHHIKE